MYVFSIVGSGSVGFFSSSLSRLSHEHGYASVSGEAEWERFADFPHVPFGVVSLDDVGHQSIDETADDVNLAAETSRTAVEVRVLGNGGEDCRK